MFSYCVGYGLVCDDVDEAAGYHDDFADGLVGDEFLHLGRGQSGGFGLFLGCIGREGHLITELAVDLDDDFLGVEGRYDDTKFMFSPRYSVDGRLAPADGWGAPGYNPPDQRKNTVIRVWGTTFKPALKKECQKLGVIILDRTMATSVLNEGGKQGGRVVGATGINVRTGEFVIVKALNTYT